MHTRCRTADLHSVTPQHPPLQHGASPVRPSTTEAVDGGTLGMDDKFSILLLLISEFSFRFSIFDFSESSDYTLRTMCPFLRGGHLSQDRTCVPVRTSHSCDIDTSNVPAWLRILEYPQVVDILVSSSKRNPNLSLAYPDSW